VRIETSIPDQAHRPVGQDKEKGLTRHRLHLVVRGPSWPLPFFLVFLVLKRFLLLNCPLPIKPGASLKPIGVIPGDRHFALFIELRCPSGKCICFEIAHMSPVNKRFCANGPAQAGPANDVLLPTEARPRPCLEPDGSASALSFAAMINPVDQQSLVMLKSLRLSNSAIKRGTFGA